MSTKSTLKKKEEEEEIIESGDEEDSDDVYEEDEEEEDSEEDEEDDEEDDEEEEEEEDSVEEYEIHIYDGETEIEFEDSEDINWEPIVEKTTTTKVEVEQHTSNAWKWLRKDWIEQHGGLKVVMERDEQENLGRKNRIQSELFEKNIEGDDKIGKKLTELVDKTNKKGIQDILEYFLFLEKRAESSDLKFKLFAEAILVSFNDYFGSKIQGAVMSEVLIDLLLTTLEKMDSLINGKEVIDAFADLSLSKRIIFMLIHILEDETHSLKSLKYPSEEYDNKLQERLQFAKYSLKYLSLLQLLIKDQPKIKEYPKYFLNLASAILLVIYYANDDLILSYNSVDIPLNGLINALATVIFTQSTDEEEKHIAFLCHAAYLARKNDYSATQLLTTLPKALHNGTIQIQILHNRALALTGMAAFTNGKFKETYACLHDLFEHPKPALILGQINMQSETRSVPQHMFIDDVTLEVMYYISSIISEEMTQPLKSKTYKKLIDNWAKHVLNVVHSSNDYLYAIQCALKDCNWKEALRLIQLFISTKNIEINTELVENEIKHICLTRFISSYKDIIKGMNSKHLSEMFSLDESVIDPLLQSGSQ
ncbi:Eukaryotic translation initiation factor 3 subunit C N-terminal domain-containing protein [Entamoeba marina]